MAEGSTRRSGGSEGCGMTVGVVGLGLIGGSFARSYHARGARVLASDIDAETLDAAMIEVVEGVLDGETVRECDLVVLAAYPAASVDWLERHAGLLGELGKSGPLVVDTAGVKRAVCDRAFELAAEHGFSFLGTHPMAGTEHSGFAHSRADLFEGAPVVLVPPRLPDPEKLELLDRAHTLLAPLGFGTYSVATPEQHDQVIAFTSQLAHVVSNAYVKSPTAQVHHGFSAGSYRDLTRVAHLNAGMWAELMTENADFLGREIDDLIASLAAYRDALSAGDADRLRMLLADGDRIKRSLDDARND